MKRFDVRKFTQAPQQLVKTQLIQAPIEEVRKIVGYAYMIADMHLVKNHLGYISLNQESSGT